MSRWAYRLHLILASAVSAVLLPVLLSGVFLAWESGQCHVQQVIERPGTEMLSLGVFLGKLNREFESVEEMEVSPCGEIVLTGTPLHRHFGVWQVDAKTGRILGQTERRSSLSRFMLTLHRSLFLDRAGRILAGICAVLAFCLLLAGGALWVTLHGQRPKVVGDIHSDLGIFGLLPLMLLTGTGVLLSAARFDVWDLPHQELTSLEVGFSESVTPPHAWDVFRGISLDEMEMLRYPFLVDEEEVFELSLRNGDRFDLRATDGQIVAKSTPTWEWTAMAWTHRVHTAYEDGWLAWLWVIASGVMLWLTFTGWQKWWRRLSWSRRLVGLAHDNYADVYIVVSSESGTTARRAAQLAERWKEKGVTSCVVDLAKFTPDPNVDRCLFLLATYGQGDAPSHHLAWKKWVQDYEGKLTAHLAVVAFGDQSYLQFAAFGKDFFLALRGLRSPASVKLAGFVNRQKDGEFGQAISSVCAQWDLPLPDAVVEESTSVEHAWRVMSSIGADNLAWIELAAPEHELHKVHSGSLLGILPSQAEVIRWYSLSKLKSGHIGILVKKHEQGLCSTHLHGLSRGDMVQARIHANLNFRLPDARPLAFVANGSGMGPFMGMIQQLEDDAGAVLFWGVQTEKQGEIFASELDDAIERGALRTVKRTCSREATPSRYVQDAVASWSELESFVEANGVWMVCGSKNMSEGLASTLTLKTGKTRSVMLTSGSWIEDCY